MKSLLPVSEYKLPVTVEPLTEGGFLARSPKLQGCLAEGDTIAAALANIVDVAAHIIDIRSTEGMGVPLTRTIRRPVRLRLSYLLPLPFASLHE